MRKIASLVVLAATSLTLAGCGSADDASTEASADTVEMPADSALEPVSDVPVADPSATATDAPEPAVPEPGATAAGDAGAAVAAKALEAAGKGEDAPE
ncbi:hypothetical protein [Porphyrobacter sp. AAP82]|uniref:hypothetical protein n=1 Tax=Porphyrobacter sp. AAP82 TaxID=1248917 RepID=UPI0003199C40|nr:hypothetical protein [Porphyrobacter sp. AAP82]